MTGSGRPEGSGKADRSGKVPATEGTPFPRSSRILRSLRCIQRSWWQPLEEPLGWWHRFFCAFVGAALWMFTRVFLSPASLAASEALVPGGSLSVAVGIVILSVWFGYLVAYQDRKCSPSRLFIEGLLFPALTGALLTTQSPSPWL